MEQKNISEVKKTRMRLEEELSVSLESSIFPRFFSMKRITDRDLQIRGHDFHIFLTSKRKSKIVCDAKFHFYDSPAFVWETKDSAHTSHAWTKDTEIDYIIWVTLFDRRGYFIDFEFLKKNWKKYALDLDDARRSDTGGEFYLLDLKSILEDQPQVPILRPFTFDTPIEVEIKKDFIFKRYRN
jgi:hypothetical protein